LGTEEDEESYQEVADAEQQQMLVEPSTIVITVEDSAADCGFDQSQIIVDQTPLVIEQPNDASIDVPATFE
jgi:hypothetical protein